MEDQNLVKCIGYGIVFGSRDHDAVDGIVTRIWLQVVSVSMARIGPKAHEERFSHLDAAWISMQQTINCCAAWYSGIFSLVSLRRCFFHRLESEALVPESSDVRSNLPTEILSFVF